MQFVDPDGFRRVLADLPRSDDVAREAALARQARLTKPPGSLGRLEEIAVWLASWQGGPPRLDRIHAAVFAGNHGIAARGVSAFPAEVTVEMIRNFERGGAAINQLTRAFGMTLAVVPVDLDRPTADFTREAAMSADDCATALGLGWRAVEPETDLLVLGEMGIANTTAAAAIAAGLLGGDTVDWVGPGTGVAGEVLTHKQAVVAEALAFHRKHLGDPLEVLRRLGGREIAALVGALAAARAHRVPVLLDGFVVGAAATVLHRLAPGALDNCLAGHVSAEPGHAHLLAALDKAPLLDLGMRLGEGSGAAAAVGLAIAAVATHAGMATFEEAGVSGSPPI